MLYRLRQLHNQYIQNEADGTLDCTVGCNDSVMPSGGRMVRGDERVLRKRASVCGVILPRASYGLEKS